MNVDPQSRPPHLFEMVLDVAASDCQTSFHMALPALLRWLQEAAGRHAEQLGIGIQALQQNNLTWMLGRLSLTLMRTPVWGETLRLTTWPSGIRGRLVAERQFILESTSGECLLKASSEWLCVNFATGRLAPLPESVKTLATPTTLAFALCREKFPTLSPDLTPLHVTPLSVRRQEIDPNRHVNNVHYAEWMQETLPEDTFFHQEPLAFDIEYKHAAKLGDQVTSLTYALDDHRFLHRILLSNGTLLAQALSSYPTKKV